MRSLIAIAVLCATASVAFAQQQINPGDLYPGATTCFPTVMETKDVSLAPGPYTIDKHFELMLGDKAKKYAWVNVQPIVSPSGCMVLQFYFIEREKLPKNHKPQIAPPRFV